MKKLVLVSLIALITISVIVPNLSLGFGNWDVFLHLEYPAEVSEHSTLDNTPVQGRMRVEVVTEGLNLPCYHVHDPDGNWWQFCMGIIEEPGTYIYPIDEDLLIEGNEIWVSLESGTEGTEIFFEIIRGTSAASSD